MSDGLRSRPYAVANDLATAAKNAAAKLRPGVWDDAPTTQA